MRLSILFFLFSITTFIHANMSDLFNGIETVSKSIDISTSEKPLLVDIRGNEYFEKDITSSSLGKVVIQNVWTTWCGELCISDINLLNELQSKNKDKLQVFGFSFENIDRDKLNKFILKNNIRYPVFSYDDNKEFFKIFGTIKGLPFTIINSFNGTSSHTGSLNERIIKKYL